MSACAYVPSRVTVAVAHLGSSTTYTPTIDGRLTQLAAATCRCCQHEVVQVSDRFREFSAFIAIKSRQHTCIRLVLLSAGRREPHLSTCCIHHVMASHLWLHAILTCKNQLRPFNLCTLACPRTASHATGGSNPPITGTSPVSCAHTRPSACASPSRRRRRPRPCRHL